MIIEEKALQLYPVNMLSKLTVTSNISGKNFDANKEERNAYINGYIHGKSQGYWDCLNDNHLNAAEMEGQ